MPSKGGFENVAEIDISLPSATELNAFYLIGQNRPGRVDVYIKKPTDANYKLLQPGSPDLQVGLVSLGALPVGSKLAVQGTIITFAANQLYSFETAIFADGAEVDKSRSKLTGTATKKSFYVSTIYTVV